MPWAVKGTGAIVRPITSTDGLRGPIKLCAIPRDGDQASGDAFRIYGAAWLRRVVVQISPVIQEVGGAALDADGCALHCVWEFPSSDDLAQTLEQQGMHRPSETQSTPPKSPIFLESNGGSFRMPRGTTLWFGGGAIDTPWTVDVIELLDYNLGHPDSFDLDVVAADGAAVLRPAWHTLVQPLAGSLLINGTVATTAGSNPNISLASPSIAARGATLYRTRVAL